MCVVKLSMRTMSPVFTSGKKVDLEKKSHIQNILKIYAEIKLRIVHNIDKIDLIKLTFFGGFHTLFYFFNHFYLLLLFFIIFKLNKIYDTEC